jgi:DHA1 family multidrug resistance protein-like MFS transporter
MSLGMNLTNSLWPLYIQSLGATVLEVSTVISLAGVVGTFLRAPSGLISDRYGRRKIIITSVLLAIAPPIFFTFSSHWKQLIPWGMLYSAAFALYMPSRMAIIADYTTQDARTRIYSIMNLSWPLGSLLAPTLAGVLESSYGWNLIFYVATVLYMFGVVPCLLLPSPSFSSSERQESIHEREKLDSTFFRPLVAFTLLNLFQGLGMGTVQSITPIYLTETFKISTAEVGLFISIGFGVTAILTQLPAGMIAERVGRKKFIATCLVLAPPFFFLWTVIDNLIILLMIQMVINGLWSMTWPATLSLLMEHTPKTRRGLASGITQTGIMLGFTIGPYIGGYLWEVMGQLTPYYGAALFFALCMPIIPFLREKEKF